MNIGHSDLTQRRGERRESQSSLRDFAFFAPLRLRDLSENFQKLAPFLGQTGEVCCN